MSERNNNHHLQLKHQVKELISSQDWVNLRDLLSKQHIPALSDLLLMHDKPTRILIFRLLPRELASKAFAHLEWKHQSSILKGLKDEEVKGLLNTLKPDDRVYLFEELPPEITRKLLNLLKPSDLNEVRQLLGYPPESVGRLMTPDYVSVKRNWTVSRALKHIRLRGKESETINIVYVVDQEWKLVGVVELRKIVLAEPHHLISEIMQHHFVWLSAFDDREKAVNRMQDHSISVLPVLDSNKSMIGIVTFDDVLDVAEEEITEDFHKTAAIIPLNTSYKEASVLSLFQRRVGWLLVLVFINLGSSGVMAAYEKTLASAIALAFFVPLLIGSGGNAGSQSATLMIRSISIGDIKMSNWFRVFLKEIAVGLVLAVSLGLVSAALGMFNGGPVIGLIVGLSMAVIVIVTNIIGSLLPFILLKLKIDPAMASGPLVTSVADVFGLVIYFSIATFILGSLV
jgi:magnesium transporter